MDARLHKAAIRGDVTSLLDLLQQDEHILDGVGVGVMVTHDPIANENPLHVAAQFGHVDFAKEILSRRVGVMVIHDPTAHENPLHVAAQFGHVDFAKEILSRKPKYALKLNSQGQSPLHLASGAEHVEVVKLLLEKDAGVCFVRDKTGRTPLHIAARKGRVEVLKELVLAEPTAAWVLTEQGEPILHLCANNGQVEALKLLIELIRDGDFVNMKDVDDNSILHLLAPELQTEVITLLLSSTNVEINSLNMKKYTPLDALLKSPRRSGYKKCKRILCGRGGKRARELSPAPTTSHPMDGTWKAHAKWLDETKSTLMVVAILIATVTFQAVLNPPGGVWQEDEDDPSPVSPGDSMTEIDQWSYYEYGTDMHHAGQAIMSSEGPLEYLLFNAFNLIGFLASVSIILLLISGFNLKRKGLMWALMIAMWFSIGSMVVSYGLSFYMLTKGSNLEFSGLEFLYLPMIVISIFASLALIGSLVTAHLVRLVIRCCKKSRIPTFEGRTGSENRDDAAIQVSVDPHPSTPTPTPTP